jgi:hypothetical protein
MRKTSTYKNVHLHSRNTGVQKYYCPSNGFKWKFYCEYKETFFSKMGPKFYILFTSMLPSKNSLLIQGESKKTDTFDIQMNNKGVSFF